jgi:type VI secretion system protein ImpG
VSVADPLYSYYETELSFLRSLGAEFAEKYPAVAERLRLSTDQSADPHVERLIEACAFLAARVHQRLDDDFPELTDALLGILYPHYLAPVPSMTIVQFEPDPEQVPESGLPIERHTLLYSRKVDEVACRFRTAYPVRLWPLAVAAVDTPVPGRAETALFRDAKAAIRVRLRLEAGPSLGAFRIESLRFHLDGDPGLVHVLYEALLRRPLGVIVRWDDGEPVRLPAESIAQVGFARDEGLLVYPRSAALGYRLLHEYFAFPEKFHFVDVIGLDCLRAAGEARSFELLLLLPEPVEGLDGKLRPDNLKLGCTPAVNLFHQDTSPIRLDHHRVEYPIVPDHRAPYSFEVHTVEDVVATVPGVSGERRFRPFYAIHHGDEVGADPAFWHATRRASIRRDDEGTDVHLTLVDPAFRPAHLDGIEVLHVRALCSNRDLPARLVFGDQRGDFQVEKVAEVRRTRCLRQPTKPLRPPLRSQSRWRLVSHLSLNHLSVFPDAAGSEPGKSASAFREILRLYDFAESAVSRQRIEGVVGVEARRATHMLAGVGPVRGLHVVLQLDESKYAGSGVFLFASVLERFLALYTTINSFTMTEVRTRQREGILKRWPPRTGERYLS